MSLLFRTEKVSDGITYTVIRDNNEYEVTLLIYNKTYETKKSLLTSVEPWVQQTVEENLGDHHETY